MEYVGNWSYPTSIRFGCGRLGELADACSSAGISRPLFVTDRGLSDLPITSRALEILDSSGLGRSLFSDVDPNPNPDNLASGIEMFMAGDHDGVVAFGGGSGLDLGKLIAFMCKQTRPVWDFEDIGDLWTRADSSVIYPTVAIPTTAGTGSEVGRAAVLTNPESRTKKIIFHPNMLPKVVICDPELTIDLPRDMTAGTGLDAFAHCVESYSSPYYHPLGQGIALEGMRLVKDFLVRAYEDGSDIEARANMMSAALMGAAAFQKGLGAIHAMSHPCGSLFNTHHGTTNAVCMPSVLSLNAPAIEERFAMASAYLGIKNGFDGFGRFVQDLNDSLGIPRKLGDLGVSPDSIDDLVSLALGDPCCGGNPVSLDENNMRGLYESCL